MVVTSATGGDGAAETTSSVDGDVGSTVDGLDVHPPRRRAAPNASTDEGHLTRPLLGHRRAGLGTVCLWEMAAARLTFRGREELKAGVAQHLTGGTFVARHVCTNTDVTLADAGHAEGLAYVIHYRHYVDHPVDPAADLDRVLAPLTRQELDRMARSSTCQRAGTTACPRGRRLPIMSPLPRTGVLPHRV